MKVYFADRGKTYEVYLSTKSGDWNRLFRGETLECDIEDRDIWDSRVSARFSLQTTDHPTECLEIEVDSENWRNMRRVNAVVDGNKIDRSRDKLAGFLSFESNGHSLTIQEDDNI